MRSIPLLILTVALLSGCAADKSLLGPKHPLSSTSSSWIRKDLVGTTDIGTWRANYEQAVLAGDSRAAKLYRNKIMRQLMLLDDEYFLAWSQKLYGTKTIGRSIGDVAQTMLAAFAAASGPASAKSLALALTAITSVRVAAEKNIFLEQNAGALIAKMEEERSKVDAQITQYLRQSALPGSGDSYDYPLEQGLRDILRYYQAGTLASASVGLEADATRRQRVASAVVETTKGDTTISRSVLREARVVEFVEPELPLRHEVDETLSKQEIESRIADAERRAIAGALVEPVKRAIFNAELAVQTRNRASADGPRLLVDYATIIRAGGGTVGTKTGEFPATKRGALDFLKNGQPGASAMQAMIDEADRQKAAAKL